MIPLPKFLQLANVLAIAAFLAIATAQAGQPTALDKAIAVQCAALDGWVTSASLRDCQDGVPPAVPDAEVAELEDDEQEPQLDVHDFTRVSPAPPPVLYEEHHGVQGVVCWVSLLLPTGHPRGPPVA